MLFGSAGQVADYLQDQTEESIETLKNRSSSSRLKVGCALVDSRPCPSPSVVSVAPLGRKRKAYLPVVYFSTSRPGLVSCCICWLGLRLSFLLMSSTTHPAGFLMPGVVVAYSTIPTTYPLEHPFPSKLGKLSRGFLADAYFLDEHLRVLFDFFLVWEVLCLWDMFPIDTVLFKRVGRTCERS